jgi:predicted metal-binding membrane protein
VSSTPQPEPLPLARLLSRPVLISALALAAAVVLAWLWLLADPMQGMMAEMPGMPGMTMAPEPWSAAYLTPNFAMWSLMMVAMMLPSAAPMILLHARIDRGTQAQRTFDNLLFAMCYLVVWAVFSLLAALAQAALLDAGLVAEAGLALGNRTLMAGVLLLAAAWQLTAAKAACLERCQSPVHFVMRYWRTGPGGAVRLGLIHGLYCVGCCWSLMLLLFVGGVMNLAWIAVLTLVVFAEKLAPPAWRISRWLAGALALGAGYLLIA